MLQANGTADLATANLRLRMQKPHVAARLLGEALGELEALGMRTAGGDGVADWFPVAALATLIKAKLELCQSRLRGIRGRRPNMKQNACSGVFR